MTRLLPLIPAEAGTQCFGDKRRVPGFSYKAAVPP